jgi:hypothetical protein
MDLPKQVGNALGIGESAGGILLTLPFFFIGFRYLGKAGINGFMSQAVFSTLLLIFFTMIGWLWIPALIMEATLIAALLVSGVSKWIAGNRDSGEE